MFSSDNNSSRFIIDKSRMAALPLVGKALILLKRWYRGRGRDTTPGTGEHCRPGDWHSAPTVSAPGNIQRHVITNPRPRYKFSGNYVTSPSRMMWQNEKGREKKNPRCYIEAVAQS